jgi:purine-binding chemotaxis protein CheW
MLLCQAGSRLCGFPIEHIAETMRPLAVESLAGMPPFVLGLAIIRGVATPVVDLGSLVAGSGMRAPATRYVTVKTGGRRAAFAVDAVVGIRALPPSTRAGLPPLVNDVRAEFVTSIATLDGDLLLVLESAKLVSPDVWAALDAQEAHR